METCFSDKMKSSGLLITIFYPFKLLLIQISKKLTPYTKFELKISNFAKIEENEVKNFAKADQHISCVKKAGLELIKTCFPFICGAS